MSRTKTTDHSPGRSGSPQCRLIRRPLFGEGEGSRWHRWMGKAGIDLDTPWIQRHVATCPRCQRRFARTGRVQLALGLLRSRPMDLGLLGRANAKAVGSLHKDVREVAKAVALKDATPEPTLVERARQFRTALTQMAACMAIVTLGKIGVFSAIQRSQSMGSQAMHQYYSDRAGQGVADEVYPQG